MSTSIRIVAEHYKEQIEFENSNTFKERIRRKCKTNDKMNRENAACLLREIGLHFSLLPFYKTAE